MYKPVKAPMTDLEFRNYLDSDGHMVKPEEFRLSIYQGGVEHSLRRVVWRHLLNIFPDDLSGRERFDYMKQREKEYFELRDKWINLFSSGQASEEAKHVASLVKKDVMRTDRTHKHYSGADDNKNLKSLFNLLVTYAVTHPEISYCQGMSDLASPLLVVQKEEAQAYLCFCGLMKRLQSNFLYDGKAITTKLQHLTNLVNFYDPVFGTYLKTHGAEDLFFCYRWLLLEMKREFPFDDSMYMLEVMWSTIPPDPPKGSLPLTDPEYTPSLMSMSPHSPTFAVKQTLYAHLLAKRRHPPKDHSPYSKSPVTEQKQNSSTVSAINNDTQDENTTNENDRDMNLNICNVTDALKAANLENNQMQVVNASSLDKTESKQIVPEENKSGDNSDKTEITRSYTQRRQEIERFPSLISGSFDSSFSSADDVIDGETDVISSSSYQEDKTENLAKSSELIELPEIASDIKHTTENQPKQLKELESEDENHSQFYLSLGENDSPVPKPEMQSIKKENVPEIKGSFFSGMKKILSSPKRKPGRPVCVTEASALTNDKSADKKSRTLLDRENSSENLRLKKQTSKGNDKITKKLPLTNSECSNDVKENNMKNKHSDSDNGNSHSEEDTLFVQVNPKNIKQKDKSDVDSGNGSLTQSQNFSEPARSKTVVDENEGLSDNKGLIIANSKEIINDSIRTMDLSDAPNNVPNVTKSNSYPKFCENHFDLQADDSTSDTAKDDGFSDGIEVIDEQESKLNNLKELPPPEDFGFGNPFLMFLCLTVLIQHRDFIMKGGMEYDELAMYFDKMVRKHNVHKVLHQTRMLYSDYIRMQQKLRTEKLEEEQLNV